MKLYAWGEESIEAARSIGMPRRTFNLKLDLIKLRLTQSYEGYDKILTEKSGNKTLFYSALNSAEVRSDVLTTILHMEFRSTGPVPIFTDGEVGFLSQHIVTRTLVGSPLTVAQKKLVFKTAANEKGRMLIDLGYKHGIQSIVDQGSKLLKFIPDAKNVREYMKAGAISNQTYDNAEYFDSGTNVRAAISLATAHSVNKYHMIPMQEQAEYNNKMKELSNAFAAAWVTTVCRISNSNWPAA